VNPRTATLVVGALMSLLGLLALLAPEFAMARVLGFAVDPAHAKNTVLGEVRGVYGGLFLVAGAWLLWAATNPASHRSLILFVGTLWLGICGGRLFGVFVDGSPGLLGWVAAVFEFVAGSVLIAVSQLARPASESLGVGEQ
jgi:hypothetical protein